MDMKQKGLSKSFRNRNCRPVVFGITCLKKMHQPEVATLGTSYFQFSILNANRTDVVVYLKKVNMPVLVDLFHNLCE